MVSEEGTTTQRRGPLVIKTKQKKGSDGGGGMGDPATAAAEAEEEPLSPASRLFHQPHFNCYIIVEMGIGRSIDVDVVKAGLESTLVRHPRFSSLQVCKEPGSKDAKWVRTKVIIDDHVVTPVLSPGQMLDDYVSSLSTTTLDFSRPLWDIHLINHPSSAEGGADASTAVLRIHHSLGDGVSLMSLLLACTRRASDPSELPALPGQRPREGAAAVASSSGRARVGAALGLAWSVLVLAWWTLADMVAFVATTVFLRDTETPLKGPEGVEFRRKWFVHRTVSFDDVRAVKTAVACTVNDVLIGVTSAGLSRYLSRVYGESDDPKKTKKGIPANTRIRSTLLVNIRPSPGIHALAEMMEGGKNSSARWGNCLSYIILPFSIVMCEDPLDYVRRAKVIAERKKKSLEAILIYNCAYWIVKIFGIKVASALSRRVLHNTTLSFSNVVGPDEEISFYGHPIVYFAPSVYGHPQALTVHYQTYMNKLTMVLAVDELVISDPERLLDDLEESLKLMKHAAATRSKST